MMHGQNHIKQTVWFVTRQAQSVHDLRLPPRISWELAFCWVIMRAVVVTYRRFGTKYQFHLQGSVHKGRTLQLGPIVCNERSVRCYHYCLRNNPEDRSSEGNLLFSEASISTLESAHSPIRRYWRQFPRGMTAGSWSWQLNSV